MGRRKAKADHGEGSLFRRTKKVGGRVREVGNFIFKIMVNGKVVWENTGTKDLDVARIKKAEILLRLQNGVSDQANKRIAAAQYFRQWLQEKERLANTRNLLKESSIKKYRNLVALMEGYLEENGLAMLEMRNFSVEHGRGFLDWLVSRGRYHGKSDTPISESGANGIWKNLRMVVRMAIKERLINEDFLDKVESFKITRRRTRLPAMAEIEEVLGYMDEPEARDTIVAVAVQGTRPSELFNLTWDQIRFHMDPPAMLIHPHEGENLTPKTESSIREVGIHKDLLAILRKWRRERPEAKGADRVFLCSDGRPMAEYPNYAYRRLCKALRAANRARKAKGQEPIPEITLRLLRHFNASWRINRAENPMPALAVVKDLGWVDTQMLEDRYYHPDLESSLSRKTVEAPFFTKDRERFAQGQSPAGTPEPGATPPVEPPAKVDEVPAKPPAPESRMSDEEREAAADAEWQSVLANPKMIFMTPEELGLHYRAIMAKHRSAPA